MAIGTCAKWHFEIWPFLWFLEAKVVNLGPIDFQLGLPLNISGNNGQYKFEVHILKNAAKIANFRHKIGQDAIFGLTLNGHNIFYPILTFEHTKMTSLARQIECR